MTTLYGWGASFLLLCALAGVWRAAKGPTRADRMQTAQLFGTVGAGILMLLGLASGREELFDVALVLALLSAVVVITFTREVWRQPPEEDEKPGGGHS